MNSIPAPKAFVSFSDSSNRDSGDASNVTNTESGKQEAGNAGKMSYAKVIQIDGRTQISIPFGRKAAAGISFPKSFMEAFSGNNNSAESLNIKLPSTLRGKPALVFSEAEINELAKTFEYTLVGKFSNGRPKPEIIRRFFMDLSLLGDFSIGLIDARHVLVKLSLEEDYTRCFSKRSYYVDGLAMRLLKWTPNFDVSEEPPIMPVWVNFPKLRIHFMNHSTLFSLGSIFGKTLQVDAATAKLSRASVVRVVVEMDITEKFEKEIWLGTEQNGYWQNVEFEGYLSYCAKCKIHGHNAESCYIIHPELRKKSFIQNPVFLGKQDNVRYRKKLVIPNADKIHDEEENTVDKTTGLNENDPDVIDNFVRKVLQQDLIHDVNQNIPSLKPVLGKVLSAEGVLQKVGDLQKDDFQIDESFNQGNVVKNFPDLNIPCKHSVLEMDETPVKDMQSSDTSLFLHNKEVSDTVAETDLDGSIIITNNITDSPEGYLLNAENILQMNSLSVAEKTDTDHVSVNEQIEWNIFESAKHSSSRRKSFGDGPLSDDDGFKQILPRRQKRLKKGAENWKMFKDCGSVNIL